MKKFLLLASALLFSSAALGAGAVLAYGPPVPFSVAPDVVRVVFVLAVVATVLLVAAGMSGRLTSRRVRAASRVALSRAKARPHLPRRRDPRPPVVLALLGLLGAGTAYAQTAAGGALSFLFASPFSDLLWTGLSLGLASLTVFGSRYLKNKTELVKGERLQQVLFLLNELVFKKVGELNGAAVDALKKYAADGKLTPAEAKAALATAVREVWATLPEAMRLLLIAAAGGEQAALDKFVVPAIEDAVGRAPRPLRALAVGDDGSYAVGSAAPREIVGLSQPRVSREVYTNARMRLGL